MTDCQLVLEAASGTLLQPGCTAGANLCAWTCFQTIALVVAHGNVSSFGTAVAGGVDEGCRCPKTANVDPAHPGRVTGVLPGTGNAFAVYYEVAEITSFPPVPAPGPPIGTVLWRDLSASDSNCGAPWVIRSIDGCTAAAASVEPHAAAVDGETEDAAAPPPGASVLRAALSGYGHSDAHAVPERNWPDMNARL